MLSAYRPFSTCAADLSSSARALFCCASRLASARISSNPRVTATMSSISEKPAADPRRGWGWNLKIGLLMVSTGSSIEVGNAQRDADHPAQFFVAIEVLGAIQRCIRSWWGSALAMRRSRCRSGWRASSSVTQPRAPTIAPTLPPAEFRWRPRADCSTRKILDGARSWPSRSPRRTTRLVRSAPTPR